MNIDYTEVMARRLANEVVISITDEHIRYHELSTKYPLVFNTGKKFTEDTTISVPPIPITLIGNFINTEGISGLFGSLIAEINNSYNCGCYIAAGFLARKLLESLVISIMQKNMELPIGTII